MPVIDSTVPERNPNTLEKKQFTGLLSLNSVLKESLKRAQSQIDNVQLIVRCESLPQVNANYDEMVRLFDDLLSMILSHPPNTSRLFLYIDCEEDNREIIDMCLEKGYKRYNIKFHTNITTHENWKLVNSQTLVNCRQILSKLNANLAVNEVSNTGCLFSLLLPGKSE